MKSLPLKSKALCFLVRILFTEKKMTLLIHKKFKKEMHSLKCFQLSKILIHSALCRVEWDGMVDQRHSGSMTKGRILQVTTIHTDRRV